MKYLATAFFLLTMMMITVSCSKDDGNNVSTNSSAPREKGEKDDQGEKNNKGNKNDIPGVKYYFDNGSNILNYFKDKPLNYNVQFGLRLNMWNL